MLQFLCRFAFSQLSVVGHAHWSNLRLPLGMRKQKSIQLQGAPTGGSTPWIPAGGTAPDPRYRLALRARHGSHGPCKNAFPGPRCGSRRAWSPCWQFAFAHEQLYTMLLYRIPWFVDHQNEYNKKLSYRRETARQLRIHAQLTRCFSAVAV